MSLLSMVSAAMVRSGLPAPANVFANTDSGVVQRVALLQDVGDELAERYTWETLNVGATIPCDGVTTLYALPAGWGGLSEGETLQSTLYPTLPVVGPVTNEEMNAFKAFPVAPLQPVWRIIDGKFEFFPVPAAGEVYTYNYYSSFWVQSAGVMVPAFTADTDISLIDEKVLTTGLEWRWLKGKGLDYAEEFRRYEMRIGRAAGRGDNSREVEMSRRRLGGYDTWPGQIPIFDGSDTEGADFGFI